MSVRRSPRAAVPVSGLHVLRLCSVFEPEHGDLGRPEAARFDPIGGMQNHTGTLTRCLDEHGLRQTVVTSRLAGRAGRTPLGRHATVVRVGLRVAHLRQLWGLGALPHVLRRREPVDVVHVHQGEDIAALLLASLAATVHRSPLVVTVHCSVRHTVRGTSARALLLRWVGGAVETRVLRRADAVVTLMHRTELLLRRNGVAADRVRTIPSGFDPRLFAGDFADAFPAAGRPRVAYVGRLAEQKRPDLLVEAFTRISRPAFLVLVGDGPMRAHIETMVRESPAAQRITTRGFVEHTAVPGVLSSVDVLVLPSAYEELGSVLVEAMALGVPVVATRVGGIPEVVRDGETGLLVPPGDVSALAAAIERLLADPALAERLGACARERSVAYSWLSLAERIVEVYRDVLGRDRQRDLRPLAVGRGRHRVSS